MYKLLSFILILIYSGMATPQNNHFSQSKKEIRVAALLEPPFIFYDFNHKLTGPVIDIFKHAAIKNKWRYKIIPVNGDVNKLITELAEHKYDMLIGSISVTLPRQEQVSFSRPFYLTPTRLAIHRHSASPLKAVHDIVSSIPFVYIIYAVLFIFLVANVIWLVERRKNQDMPSRYINGIIFSCWFFITHFFKGGLLYRPKTNLARFILVVWLVLALSLFLVVTSTYTAYIMARMVAQSESIDNIDDLHGKQIAYVKGQEYADFPSHVGAIGVPVSDMKKALFLVENKEIFAVVGGQTILEADIKEANISDVVVSSLVLGSNEYVFAFPLNSPYLRPMNISIVEMRNSGAMITTCKVYLGDNYLNCRF